MMRISNENQEINNIITLPAMLQVYQFLTWLFPHDPDYMRCVEESFPGHFLDPPSLCSFLAVPTSTLQKIRMHVIPCDACLKIWSPSPL